MRITEILTKKKIVSIFLTAAVLVGLPMIVNAGFAPSNRLTYQCVTPTNCPGADHVQFNSFTNAPNYGDERAFFDAKDATQTSAGGYQDKVTVKDGQKLTARVYVHNNANPNAIGEAAATAKNTRLQVLLPTNKKANNVIAAQIAADNASPANISDTVDLTGELPFNVEFDTSAPVQITYRPNGTGGFVTRTLPGAAFSNTSTLNANLGDMKGCFEYAAFVTVTLTVKMDKPTPPPPPPPVVMKKCDALDVVKVNRTRFDFTARASVQNAVIQNYVFTAKDASGATVDTKTVTTNATTANYSFERATPGTYTINAVVNTDKGVAEGVCVKQITIEEQPVTPVFECRVLDVNFPNKAAEPRKIVATVQSNPEGASAIKSVTYEFGEAGVAPLVTDKTTVEHTYKQDGDYTIRATITFNNGTTSTSASCAKSINVKTPPPPVTPPVVQGAQAVAKGLPNTGAGGVVGIFAGASTLAGAFHYFFTRRRD